MKEAKSGGSGSSRKGESHRIYWQQWPSAGSNKTSRRDLITSSAAIRISPDGARSQDVTRLLCETLNLKGASDNNKTNNDNDKPSSPRQESWDKIQDAWEQDSLVLVGTLYSLPLHYVQFEHEISEMPSSSSPLHDKLSEEASTKSNNRRDPPFHVIRTLSSTENPIKVRNEMVQHLERLLLESSSAVSVMSSKNSNNKNGVGNKYTNSIAPKLQWYFVPGSHHPSSPIPSYIDLDGYCTCMEEGDDELDDEHDNSQHSFEADNGLEHDFDPDDMIHLPLSVQEDVAITKQPDAPKADETKMPCTMTEKDRILKRERFRYFELTLCQSSSAQHDCVSGYLLKQSMADPHVWKRVHCVLTDDYLWHISRIYTRCDEADDDAKDENQGIPADDEKEENEQRLPQQNFYAFAKHRRLDLNSALLLQPSSDKPMSPLYRTPFAFELIASNGVAHRFRATSAESFKRWIDAMSSRIVQSYENSLFEHAELIVRDETEARHKRYSTLAVEPLWDYQQQFIKQKPHLLQSGEGQNRHFSFDSATMKVLRFGMEVSEYRERCRHIQAILPPMHPVLAISNGDSFKDSDMASVSSNASGGANFDTKTQALIKSAWDEAISLGSRAAKIAADLQLSHHHSMNGKNENGITASSASKSAVKMPGSLETICRHLEYVITGRRGCQNSSGKSRTDNTRQYPPPSDLFDILLSELQTIAASAANNGNHAGVYTNDVTFHAKPSMNGSSHCQKMK